MRSRGPTEAADRSGAVGFSGGVVVEAPTGWSMRNSIQNNRESLREVVTARSYPAAESLSCTIRLLVMASLAMGLAFAQGCAKKGPSEGAGVALGAGL